MKELDEALADILEIRNQMARSVEFRGYGPVTLAATGMLALLAGWIQARWLADPVRDVAAYLTIWLATAAISAFLIAIEAVTRSRRVHSGLADAMIQMAANQFLPHAAAGGLLCVVLAEFAPAETWMLPGLWQVVFSLGVFASCRFLPKATFAVGVWYLATGLAALAFAQGPWALSPWIMALPFGIGQLALAAVVQRSRSDHLG